jgi:hypothetical protein
LESGKTRMRMKWSGRRRAKFVLSILDVRGKLRADAIESDTENLLLSLRDRLWTARLAQGYETRPVHSPLSISFAVS